MRVNGVTRPYSVDQVKKSSAVERKQLIGNKPLAHSLSTVIIDSDNLLDMMLPVCPLNGKSIPIIKPVLTPSGSTYEERTIRDFLDRLRKKDLPEVDQKNQPLKATDLIPNIALEQLIHMRFIQRQFQRKQLLAKEKKISKEVLDIKIKNLDNKSEDYRDSLFCEKLYLNEIEKNIPSLENKKAQLEIKKIELQIKIEKYQSTYDGWTELFPVFANKNIDELNALDRKYNRQKFWLNTLANAGGHGEGLAIRIASLLIICALLIGIVLGLGMAFPGLAVIGIVAVGSAIVVVGLALIVGSHFFSRWLSKLCNRKIDEIVNEQNSKGRTVSCLEKISSKERDILSNDKKINQINNELQFSSTLEKRKESVEQIDKLISSLPPKFNERTPLLSAEVKHGKLFLAAKGVSEKKKNNNIIEEEENLIRRKI